MSLCLGSFASKGSYQEAIATRLLVAIVGTVTARGKALTYALLILPQTIMESWKDVCLTGPWAYGAYLGFHVVELGGSCRALKMHMHMFFHYVDDSKHADLYPAPQY